MIQVVLPGTCRRCHDAVAVVADDGQLRCRSCRRDRGSLPDEAQKFLEKVIATFGEPTEPIVIRSNPSPCLSARQVRRPSIRR